QIGDGNKATIEQRPHVNDSNQMNSANNTGIISQVGDANTASLLQVGSGDNGTFMQTGDSNWVDAFQNGSYNMAWANQTGDQNELDIVQSGAWNESSNLQIG